MKRWEDLRAKLDSDGNMKCLTKCFTNLEKNVSPLCSFCMEEPESPIDLFHSCTKKLSLDEATAFFPKCANNPSSYTTECHL